MHRAITAIILTFVSASPALALGGFQQEGTIPLPGTNGEAYAVSGDTAAYLDANSRQIHIFVRTGTTWSHQQTVAGPGSPFLLAVALDGDALLAGAGVPDAMYVFERSGTTWSLAATLSSSTGDLPGQVIGISGDTAVMAASSGLHVYVRSGPTWTDMQETNLFPSFASRRTEVAGDIIAVNSRDTATSNNNIHIYERLGSTWAGPTATLSAGPIGIVPLSPRTDGDTVVANIPAGSDPTPRFFVWEKPGSFWSDMAAPSAILSTSLTGVIFDRVDVSGDTIAASLIAQDPNLPPGSPQDKFLAIYDRPTGGWVDDTESESHPSGTTAQGPGVAIDGDTVLAGTLSFRASGAGLTLSNTADRDPVNAGADLIYTLVVENTGSTDLTGVVLQAALPASTSFVSATVAPPTCNHSGDAVGGIFSCAWAGIQAGAAEQVEVVVATDPTSAGLTLTNTATSFANEPGATDMVVETTQVVPALADLEVTQRDLGDPALAGDEVFYEVLVSNFGPGNANGVVLTDTLPAGAVFQSYSSPDPANTCVHNNGIVTCNLSRIPSPTALGFVQAASVTFRVILRQTGVVFNTAGATGMEPDPGPRPNVDVEDTTVLASGITITDTVNDPNDRLLDFGGVNVGDTVQGILTVANTGAVQVTIGPAASPLGLPFQILNPAACFGVTLQPGGSCGLIVQFTPTAGGLFSDSFDLNFGTQVVTVNVTGSGLTQGGSVDLRVEKVVDQADVSLGDIVTFTITVRNVNVAGVPNLRTVGVLVKDKLPNQLVIPTGMSATPSKGLYAPRSGEWIVGDLAPGESATLTLPAKTIKKGCVENIARVSTTTQGVTLIRLFDDEATAAVAVDGCADLAIVDTVQYFDYWGVNWALLVQNLGPGKFDLPLQLTLKLPSGARFAGLEESSSVPAAVFNGLFVSAGPDPIPPGSEIPINLMPDSSGATCTGMGDRERVCTVTRPVQNDCRPGLRPCAIVIEASVVGTGFGGGFHAEIISTMTPDPDPQNNSNPYVRPAPRPVGIPEADLELSLSADSLIQSPLIPVHFDMEVTNDGPNIALASTVNVRWKDDFWDFVRTSHACQEGLSPSHVCTMDLGDIAAGDSRTVEIFLVRDPTDTSGPGAQTEVSIHTYTRSLELDFRNNNTHHKVTDPGP